MTDVRPEFIKIAEEKLPHQPAICNDGETHHTVFCPAYYRPAVAKALQEAYVLGAGKYPPTDYEFGASFDRGPNKEQP